MVMVKSFLALSARLCDSFGWAVSSSRSDCHIGVTGFMPASAFD